MKLRHWFTMVAIVLLMVVGILSVGCAKKNPAAAQSKVLIPIRPIEVQDDGRSLVYIYLVKIDFTTSNDVTNPKLLLSAARSWEDDNPTKIVDSVSMVTGNAGGHGQPVTAGIVMHYKLNESPKKSCECENSTSNNAN
jgi:hypothetical protein